MTFSRSIFEICQALFNLQRDHRYLSECVRPCLRRVVEADDEEAALDLSDDLGVDRV